MGNIPKFYWKEMENDHPVSLGKLFSIFFQAAFHGMTFRDLNIVQDVSFTESPVNSMEPL